jgi:4-cresol dehydrogenase (hydroxylating)
LTEWESILGANYATAAPAILQRYAKTTLPRARLPAAVLQPATVAEVAAIVEVARRYRVPLYPISRGRNWGYGDACAPTDGQTIVDLSRMNRIIEINDELAYAVIEPGVTQGQLAAALRDGGHRLFLDCTGAGPDASIVGNVLERGIGHTPYGVRDLSVSGFEVVLGDGRILRTGFGHYAGARAAHLYSRGIGPSLDGLFAQSNLGIVVRAGIWLLPQTEAFKLLIAFVPEDEDVCTLIDVLRGLKLAGTIRSVAHIANDLRLITGSMTYPRSRAGGAPLDETLRRALRRESAIGAWGVSTGLYGTRREVAAMQDAIARALRGRGWRVKFVGEEDLTRGGRAARLLARAKLGRRLSRQLGLMQLVLALHQGSPTGRFLAGAYWRRRGGLPPAFPDDANPAADNCGLYWLSPVLPMTGAAARQVIGIVAPIFTRYGFDLPITFSMVSDRALGGVITIAYDREDAAETQRARECHDAALEALMRAGYIPYRVGLDAMGALATGSQTYWDVVGAIKSALDPDRVLAPGRYDPKNA